MFVSFYLMHTQFFIQYIMYIFAGFAALTFFALSVVGILWCTKAVDTHYVKDKKTHVYTAYNTTCPNDETAAIVTASLAVVDCVAITVCGFVGMILSQLQILWSQREGRKVSYNLIWISIFHYLVVVLNKFWEYHGAYCRFKERILICIVSSPKRRNHFLTFMYFYHVVGMFYV